MGQTALDGKTGTDKTEECVPTPNRKEQGNSNDETAGEENLEANEPSEWQVVGKRKQDKKDRPVPEKSEKPLPIVLDNIAPRFTSRRAFYSELNRCQPELGARIKVTYVTKLERGGVTLHQTDILSFNHLLKPENWPNDAFGCSLKVHLPA